MGRATPSALSPSKPPSVPPSAANKFFRHLPFLLQFSSPSLLVLGLLLLLLHYNFTSLWLV